MMFRGFAPQTNNLYADPKKELSHAAMIGSLEHLQQILWRASDEKNRKELINFADNWFGTILHAAACYGHVHVIQWILSEQGGRAAGFNSVLVFSQYKYTALHVAVENGHLEACKAIVNGCRVDNGERAEMLNSQDRQHGWTVLHCAVKHVRLDIIKWLLSDEEGGGRALGFVSVLARTTSLKSTALLLAQSLETFVAVVDGCKEDNGERQAMLNIPENSGWTHLHLAAIRNQPAIISWLLSPDKGMAAGFDRSSNLNAVTVDEKSSIFHVAAGSSIECMQMILWHSSQEERMNLFLRVDDNGWTALFYAARNSRLECIAEIFQQPESKMIANRKDDLGMTVLHRAVIGGLFERSKMDWAHNFQPDLTVISTLLGSSVKGLTSIDPNIGLGL